MMENVNVKRAETLAEMLKNFNPRPLDEDTLPLFYCDNTMPVRMGKIGNPMRGLFDACMMPLSKNAHLLAGHRGCGKSTELFNLKQQFQKEQYPVMMVQAELDLNMHLADCWDIMFFITKALFEIAKENEIELSPDMIQNVFDYLNQEIEITTENSDSARIDANAGGSVSINLAGLFKLFTSIKSDLEFGTQKREVLKEKVTKQPSEWLRYIKEISDIIMRQMDGKQPIIIFEGLDKIQPYERAFDIFRHEILLKMPFPIIYSFPISLIYDHRYGSLSLYNRHVLPMIKISNVDKTPNLDGIEIIRQIIEKRADLQLFDEDALNEMITKTGGVLRHLFECIITAARYATWRDATKIEYQDAIGGLSKLSAETLTLQIEMSDYPDLAKIHDDINYRKGIDKKSVLLKLIQASVILEYRNGDRWHDLHPLIADFLRKQGVIDVEN